MYLHSFPTRRSSDLSSGVNSVVITPPNSENSANSVMIAAIAQIQIRRVRSRRSKKIHTSSTAARPYEIGRAHVELQSRGHLVCRLLHETKKMKHIHTTPRYDSPYHPPV